MAGIGTLPPFINSRALFNIFSITALAAIPFADFVTASESRDATQESLEHLKKLVVMIGTGTTSTFLVQTVHTTYLLAKNTFS